MFSTPSPLSPEHLRLLILAMVGVSGAGWSLAYLLILRRTHLDRALGMPLLPLCFNVAWEAVFSVVPAYAAPAMWAFRIWLALDLVMFAQALLYGQPRWRMPRPAFHLAMVGAVGLFALLTWWTTTLGDARGILISYGDNILMSVLFIAMLRRRGDSRGQSLWIGLCKLVGTLAPSILCLVRYPGAWVLWLICPTVLALDIAYLVLLRRQLLREGLVRPWRRW